MNVSNSKRNAALHYIENMLDYFHNQLELLDSSCESVEEKAIISVWCHNAISLLSSVLDILK